MPQVPRRSQWNVADFHLLPSMLGAGQERQVVSEPTSDQVSLDARVLDDVADALICADRSDAIVRLNRAAHLLFGYAAEEALGRSLDLIIPEHLRTAHWNGFDAAITSGTMTLQGCPTLTRALRKSGRRALHRDNL